MTAESAAKTMRLYSHPIEASASPHCQLVRARRSVNRRDKVYAFRGSDFLPLGWHRLRGGAISNAGLAPRIFHGVLCALVVPLPRNQHGTRLPVVRVTGRSPGRIFEPDVITLLRGRLGSRLVSPIRPFSPPPRQRRSQHTCGVAAGAAASADSRTCCAARWVRGAPYCKAAGSHGPTSG